MKGNLIISKNNSFYNIRNNLIKVNIDGNFNKVKNPYRISNLYIHGNNNSIEVINNGKINNIKVFGNNNKIYIKNNSTSEYHNFGIGNELIKKNNFPLPSPPNFMPMNPFFINNINYNNNFLNQINNNNNINNIEEKTNNILNNLEEHLFSEVPDNLKADNLSICSICGQNFLNLEKIRIFTCKKHIFHSNCIKNWIRGHINSPSCPKCSNINNLNMNLNPNNNIFVNPCILQPRLIRFTPLYNHHLYHNNNLNHNIDNLENDLDDLDLYDDDIDDMENEFDSFDDLYSGIKKGLNKNILDNMVITKMKNVEKLDNDKKKCTICLENYKDGDDFIALPCIHIFHSDCIKTWLKNQTTCPICKNEIKYDGYEGVGLDEYEPDLDDLYE